MKALICFVSGGVVALVCVWLASCHGESAAGTAKHGFSSFDPPHGEAAAVQFEAGKLNLTNADLEQMMKLYQDVSARTVIRGPGLKPLSVTLVNQTALTRVETLQLLDTVLAENGITMVVVGDSWVKAVASRDAGAETPPSIDPTMVELPDSSSLMTCTVQLKNADPQQVVQSLTYAAGTQNSIIYVPSGKMLILRDYSSNVRRMLEIVKREERKQSSLTDILKPGTNAAGK
jgi:type II secretory pathway component GspD/PulD (secretin)